VSHRLYFNGPTLWPTSRAKCLPDLNNNKRVKIGKTVDTGKCVLICLNNVLYLTFCSQQIYTLSEAWSGVNWADLMAAQGAFGTDVYDRSILCPMHRAYYRFCRPVIKIGPKGALGSHEIRTIHSAPSLGQSIHNVAFEVSKVPGENAANHQKITFWLSEKQRAKIGKTVDKGKCVLIWLYM